MCASSIEQRCIVGGSDSGVGGHGIELHMPLSPLGSHRWSQLSQPCPGLIQGLLIFLLKRQSTEYIYLGQLTLQWVKHLL